MNTHCPLVALGLQSNSDAQPVLTRHQAEMYCCKYVSKHLKRWNQRGAIYEVLDTMDEKDKCAEAKCCAGFQPSQIGGSMQDG